jgi:two-component system response regulator CpxR
MSTRGALATMPVPLSALRNWALCARMTDGTANSEARPLKSHFVRGRSLSVFHSTGPVCGNGQPPSGSCTLVVCRCIPEQLAPKATGQKGYFMRPRKTILCVDDNEQALSVRKFMLETRGYRVLTAHTAAEALEIFAAGNVDLVLSDLIMPQMDGNELVRRMKTMAPEVPTIILSGSVKNFERASSADAFLPKGACTPLEVLERIRVMIARKRGPRKAQPRDQEVVVMTSMGHDPITAAG